MNVTRAVRRLRVRLAAWLAYRRLRACGGEGVLVGTAGLLFWGFDVEVPDVDFLCRDATVPGPATINSDGDLQPTCPRAFGFPVHYIARRDEGRDRFYHPERASARAGVLVAHLDDIIGLKHWAGRPKDHEFLDALKRGEFPWA